MTDRPSWFRLLTAAALIGAFVATARGGSSAAPHDGASFAACELDPPREIAALERCLATSPRDVELMLDLGSLHERSGGVDRAEALYRRALSVDPRDGDLHVRLGQLLLRRGEAAAAEAEARTALALQPRSARALHLLGQSRTAGTR